MIRKAASHDLDAVEQIYMERVIWERKNERYSGWIGGVWPSRAHLRRAISSGELYALWDNAEACAAMILRRGQPEEYERLHWPVRSFPSQVVSVSLLCVSPMHAHVGLGTQMLHYAIRTAQRTRARAVRLDCRTANVPMTALLRKTGFVLAATGTVPDLAGEMEPAVFFEYDTVPVRG